jgi:hypothetical protein
MDGHNKLFFNEYFLQHSFINQVKLSKNVRKWRDFYNPLKRRSAANGLQHHAHSVKHCLFNQLE